jgi:FkbM family methyltransferase
MNPTVYDCGGRWGLHRSWQAFPFRLNYVAFEPDAEEAQSMSEGNNKDKGNYDYHVIPKAVSRAVEKRSINLYQKRDLTSFYTLNPHGSYRYDVVPLDAQIEMDCVDIATASVELGLKPDFLNIDVQGASLDVIEGAGTVLQDIIGIRCEAEFIELYLNAPRFDAVARYLWSNHWKLIRVETCGDGSFGVSTDMNRFSIGPHDSVPAFCDCIFINDALLDRLLARREPEDRRRIFWAVAFLLFNGAGFYAMEILERLDPALDFKAIFADLQPQAAQSLAAGLIVYLTAPRTNINAGKTFDNLVQVLKTLAENGPLGHGALELHKAKVREVYKLAPDR